MRPRKPPSNLSVTCHRPRRRPVCRRRYDACGPGRDDKRREWTQTHDRAHDIQIEDVAYRDTPSGALLTRLYRPTGAGPFPAVISAHGGRWVSKSRLTNEVIDKSSAEAGIVVMALDFRMPPDARYPEPVADINFAIRWLKHFSSRYNSAPELVGSVGTSSGGHPTMLNALKPTDPRYSSIALPGSNATSELTYVVACWPCSIR